MIVKTNVKNIDGIEVETYFLVRFDHSKIPSPKPKNWRRTGKCTIYLLTDDGMEEDAFASRICGEKFKHLLVSESIQCNSSDTYLKAFSRRYTLQKCLKQLMENWKLTMNQWGWRLDNGNFKDFMNTLAKDHPHGDKQAIEMIRNLDYIISSKKKKK